MMICAIAASTSCTKEQTTTTENKEVNARFSIQLPSNTEISRAAFDNPTLSGMRVVMAVMYDDIVVHTQTKSDQELGDASTPVDFDLRLVTGKNYKVAIWADFGPQYYSVSTEVGTAPKVELASNTLNGSNNKYDAYFKIDNIMFTSANEVKPFILKRPFGLVKINTTDNDAPTVANAGLRAASYRIASITAPTELSLVDASVSQTEEIEVEWSAVSEEVGNGSPKELSFDYFLAGEIQSPLTNFSVAYKSSSDEDITSYDFTNIPLRRNFITNITGNILTKKGTISVTVDPMWENTIPTQLWDGGYEEWKMIPVKEKNAQLHVTFFDTQIEHHAFYPWVWHTGNGGPLDWDDAILQHSGAMFETFSAPNATKVGEGAFSELKSIKYALLPKATEIGYNAFSSSGLCECYLPQALTIGFQAFQGSTSLKSVELPKVTSIDFSAFNLCTSLEHICVPSLLKIAKPWNTFGMLSALKYMEIGTNNGGSDVTGFDAQNVFNGTDVSKCDLVLGSGITSGAPNAETKQWLGLTWKSITIK